MTIPGRRALQIFEDLVASGDADWAARLDQLCAGDSALRAEVECLHRFDGAGLVDESPTWPRAQAALALATGARLAGFEILGPLGRGAHGVVYRARQDRPPREVALKVIADADGGSVQRRFAVEIAAQARLNHPGIVQVYEVGIAETTQGVVAFLAMELVVDGVPLLTHAQDRRPELRERVTLLARIADALDHAHQRGVLHRDLKPENILVVEVDSEAQPKLLDFGVAHARDVGEETPGFAGTPAYCAPERMLGDGDAWDVRSDVYSLGVVAYEVLTGHLPIDVRGEALGEAMVRVAAEVPRPASSHDRRLRGDLEHILRKATARPPEQRYASAREFAADLRRHLHDEPVLARAGGGLYRFGRFLRRRPGSAAAALGLGASVLIALGAAAYRHAQTRWALGIVNSVLATAIDGMDRLPGTARVRGECLDSLLAEIAPVVTALPDDPHVLGVYADILRSRGHVARDLGDLSAAMDLRRRGLAAREAVAAIDPGPEVMSELAHDLVLVGDVHQDSHAFAAARPWYERAHGLFAALAAAHPDSRRFVDDLGCSCDRLVGVWNASGGEDDAMVEALLAQRGRINETLLRLAPDHHATLLGVNTHQSLLADRAQRRGDFAGALAHQRARLESARQLMARFGGEKLSRVRLIDAASRLAESALALGSGVEASAVLAEVRPVAEAVRAGGEEPGQWESLYFFVNAARVALAEGRFEESERLARGLAEHLALHGTPNTAWILPLAAAVAEDAARARR